MSIKKLVLLSVASLSALVSPLAASAEDGASPLTVSSSIGFYTDYMFRGTNLYEGTSIQPAITVTYDTGMGQLSGGLWMHLSGESDRQEDKYTELDETLAYQFSVDALTFKFGHLWYTYPDSDDNIDDTAEFFAAMVINDADINPILSLTPTFSVYRDYDLYDATYYELGLSHTFAIESLGSGFNIAPFVAFGFASDAEKLYANDGLVQTTFGVNFTATLGDVQVVPSINVTRESDDNAVNEFWVGTSLIYNF